MTGVSRPMRAALLLAAALAAGTRGAGAAPPAPAAPVDATPAAAHAPRPDAQRLDYDLQPRRIAEGTWVIEGALADFVRANGCNIINTAFIATGDGVLVINTGPSRLYGEQQRRAIARVTAEPVRQVLNLNLHPDYFLGNQAWADTPVAALAGSIAGQRAEGAGYEDNLYRVCGDWMRGTQAEPARVALDGAALGQLALGGGRFTLARLHGHTGDDLVLLDGRTGVLFAGGLVFAERVPTTPHADLAAWLVSLDTLARWHAQGRFTQVVPSHGPVHAGLAGVAQTRDWLQWLQRLMEGSAERGVDLAELLRQPVPERFAHWGAQPAELQRSLVRWYPQYERQALRRSAPR